MDKIRFNGSNHIAVREFTDIQSFELEDHNTESITVFTIKGVITVKRNEWLIKDDAGNISIANTVLQTSGVK